MKKVFQKKGSLAAVAFQRLVFATSVGLLAFSSQFSHAAPTGTASSEYISGAPSSIDKNVEADAELTDLSINLNFNPYRFRGRNNNRRIQKGFRNGSRSSYFYPYSAYDSYGQPIYRDYRRKSGSSSGRRFGRSFSRGFGFRNRQGNRQGNRQNFRRR